MRTSKINAHQSGVALVVALLFLLVVTVISVTAANNSSVGLKMAANMSDSYSSFQSAEAGIFGLLGLANTAFDPFDGSNSATPFVGIPASSHPLRNLNLHGGAGSVDVDLFITAGATQCPRQANGYSTELLDCDYYRVASEHQEPQKARTKVELGVVKTIIGSTAR
ncbi:MAG: type IV pilus assembly protein PilX [Halioglobus sp.]|jgi:type IV pilus assembly protein PilX